MNRRADLNPPLGWKGGPCQVVDRIEDAVHSPAVQQDLEDKVEHGTKLTNQETAQVYSLETEQGGGLFRQMLVTPHAQYRMDLRGITVGDLRTFFTHFSKKLNDWKSQHSWEWDYYSRNLAQGESVEWVDKKLGDLKVAFSAYGRSAVRVVTVFWEGKPDPKPVHCPRTAREVEDMSPARTFVKDPSPSKSDTDKPEGESGKYPTRGLPDPPWRNHINPKGPQRYNVPGESGSNSDGTIHKDKVRTKGVPGEQSPPADPPARISPVRRPGMTAGMYPPAYPTGKKRHRKQRGQAYRYDLKRYRKQRGVIIQRMKRRYRRLKNNGNFKRDRQRRRDQPERFKTLPSGGVRSVSDRSKRERERQKKKAFRPVPFYLYESGQWGWIIEVSQDGMVSYDIQGSRFQDDLEPFLDEAIIQEDDLDMFMNYLDGVFGYQEEGHPEDVAEGDPTFDTWVNQQQVEKLAAEVLADFLREQRPPEMSSDTKYDRANNHEEWARRKRRHLEDISEYTTENEGNPGSKVLPSGAGHVEKEAALITDIQQGCSPDLVAKSQGLSVRLRRVDARNSMWLFDVQGSKEPYRIRLQALRQGNTKALAKSHIRVSCTCPFWRWQGPEHWAKQGDYLYGKPVGTAARPNIKDPAGHHRACKHVLAVLHFVSSRKWNIPSWQSKKGSLRYLADTLDHGEVFPVFEATTSLDRLVARYLASQEVL